MNVDGIRMLKQKESELRVGIGTTVTIVDLKTGLRSEYKIVSSAKPGERYNDVSSWSPLGKALIGRRTGESIDVEAPKARMYYKILKITHMVQTVQE